MKFENFEILLKKISSRLNIIARKHNGHNSFIDEDDIYQEMCIHLWNKFKNGVPNDINDTYIIRGCEFHILNYLRKKREKVAIVRLEKSINEDGDTLKDILADKNASSDICVDMDKQITISKIKNYGFSKREKEIFSFLLEGYTVREIGNKLGISHVRVVKIKKMLIDKWHRENIIEVTKNSKNLL